MDFSALCPYLRAEKFYNNATLVKHSKKKLIPVIAGVAGEPESHVTVAMAKLSKHGVVSWNVEVETSGDVDVTETKCKSIEMVRAIKKVLMTDEEMNQVGAVKNDTKVEVEEGPEADALVDTGSVSVTDSVKFDESGARAAKPTTEDKEKEDAADTDKVQVGQWAVFLLWDGVLSRTRCSQTNTCSRHCRVPLDLVVNQKN